MNASLPSPVLILGIGNYLMGDEGVGVHLVRELEKETLPEGVDLLDGGTAGFQLMEYVEKYPVVIMVDATLDQFPAGSIPRFSELAEGLFRRKVWRKPTVAGPEVQAV